MFSEEKIKQVFNAIKDNGLNAFDDDALAKLLSILNRRELDAFEERAEAELGSRDRISRVRPRVEILIDSDLLRIRNSDVYQMYIESLKRNRYMEFFKSLRLEELGDLKKYIINTSTKNTETASKKILNIITQEIVIKSQNKNLVFE